MSQSPTSPRNKTIPDWTVVSPSDPATHPPKDGDWFELPNGIACIYDNTIGRFFNGRDHAVAEASITLWRRG